MTDAPEFNALDDIGTILVKDIDLGERLRPIDPIWADALGQVMLREGQRTPVTVCRLPGTTRWLVVAGGHRVEGARLAGISHVKAEVIGSGRAERRQAEVSENIWRRELSPIDRAAFVAELVALKRAKLNVAEDKKGRSISADARWSKHLKAEAQDANVTMTLAFGFADTVAEELGFSRETVFRDLMLHRRLSPSIVLHLRTLPIAKNGAELRALAKLDESQQFSVVQLMLDGQAKRVSEALGILSAKPKPAPDAKRLSAFIGAFSRMGVAEKKGALAQLEGHLPAGFSLTQRPLTAEEIFTVFLTLPGVDQSIFAKMMATRSPSAVKNRLWSELSPSASQ